MIEKLKRSFASLSKAAKLVIVLASLVPGVGIPAYVLTGAEVVVGLNETVQSGALDQALAPITGEKLPTCAHPEKITPCVTCHEPGDADHKVGAVKQTTCAIATCHPRGVPTAAPAGEGGGR